MKESKCYIKDLTKRHIVIRVFPDGYSECWICTRGELVEFARKDSGKNEMEIYSHENAVDYYYKDNAFVYICYNKEELSSLIVSTVVTDCKNLLWDLKKLVKYTEFQLEERQ